MIETPKPELSDYEEEKIPLDDVLRQILKAKPTPKKPSTEEESGVGNNPLPQPKKEN